MIRKLAEDPKFMELYDKEAYEFALKKELHENGLKEGHAAGKTEGRIEGEKIGHKKGRIEGEKAGFLKSKIEMAKKLFQMNMKLEDISKVTELSPEEIQKLVVS